MRYLAIALALFTGTAAAPAKADTDLQKWVKKIRKVAAGGNVSRPVGLCVCLGGDHDKQVGAYGFNALIVQGGDRRVEVFCYVRSFDGNTQEMKVGPNCLEGGGSWLPMTK